ncbi:odorant receptor 43a-like [Nilaparvata lugens]|uniref:odorant receptor 43a-like n=1 Tax=Nilaparvata lugens TaxID=108931 RepID=UPI00193DA593|nr:odorant receptor 43a-like [Nilaparvata lugens]
MVLDSCFSIFYVMQMENSKVVMSYASVFFFSNIFLLLCYYSGQQICDQNEIFRRRLADLPWINKPKWFKQSMLIMMSRANVDTEIKPYRMFVMNLTTYKDLMKAAFSFGNMLYTYKMAGKEE